MKVAVVLFNLGGPDSPEAVEPFLFNLFSDPAILSLPGILRRPLARLIARRRAPVAREIYAKIGGRSPILEQTQGQAHALEMALAACGHEAKAFVAMRCARPFAAEAVAAVKAWMPEKTVLLPLYPQFSTTTTASSFSDWNRAARKARFAMPQASICCYPTAGGFIAAQAQLILEAFAKAKTGVDYRLLLSAHGLPRRVIAKGDPYQWQVEKTARAIVDSLGIMNLDWTVCYQSRVGPLQWLQPATDAEVARAGADEMGVVVAPIAFVCEHSETLVELDIEYEALARETGAADYIRVPAVGTHPAFIASLRDLVLQAALAGGTVTSAPSRLCPAGFACCAYR